MDARFEFGDPDAPRGHALVYFRIGGQEQVLATYLIVLPIPINLAKYIPPALAPRLASPAAGADAVSVTALPPIPEPTQSLHELRLLAERRHDDLIDAGTVTSTDPERLMYVTHEIAQEYARACKQVAGQLTSQAAVEQETGPDEDTLRFMLMGEKERLAELAKSTGKLRYAVEGNDSAMQQETAAQIAKLGSFLAPKYRIDEFLEAAQVPGQRGRRLAELFLDRCFKLADEAYEALGPLDEEIAALRAG